VGPLSPGTDNRQRGFAISYFRRARDANSRYAEYKEVETQKKKASDALSMPTKMTALQRIRRASQRLSMVNRMGFKKTSEKIADPGYGGGNIGGQTNLIQLLMKRKQERLAKELDDGEKAANMPAKKK